MLNVTASPGQNVSPVIETAVIVGIGDGLVVMVTASDCEKQDVKSMVLLAVSALSYKITSTTSFVAKV